MANNSNKLRGENAPFSCPSCTRKRNKKQLEPIEYFLANNPPSDLITFDEMSKIANRSIRTVKGWAKLDSFPSAVKHRGRTVGFSRYQYEKWLNCKQNS